MASHKRKLNVLPIEEKIKILDFLDQNPLLKKGDVAKKFDIPASTLSTIIKNRNSLVTSNKNAKKIRKCTFEDLDECLTVWFEQCHEQRIPVSGVMLQEKATEFAKKIGYDNFKASNGWLESFKCRKGIVFRKICGESAAVPQNVCDKWVEDELPSLTKNFDPVDIFNADETGLFYQCLPNKTAVFKGQECRGGKQSKIRVTVLLGANQDGSEKLPPLMIGRSANPRCFKSVKSFPIAYESNRKAWMTSELFGQWLKKIDRSMGSKKRKILLFIGNCKAHSKLPLLKNISVKFLPANTTSKLQPLDQGVIRSFKVYYRKELIRKLLNSIDEKKTLPKINVLDAMRMIDYAWRNVSEKTIKNGFIQAGFKKMTEEPENGQETEDIDIELQEEDWMEFRKMLEDVSFEEFVNVDDAVATCGVLTEEEIINEVRGDSGEDDDETEHIDVPKVSAKDAENAIETIRNFLESQEGVGEDGFSAIAKLRRIVSEKKNVCHQTLLTDFFQ